MSYKQVVLRDNPIAFWPLNGTSGLRTYNTILLEYQTYQDWLANEPNYNAATNSFTLQDVSQYGNHAAFTIGSPNFTDVLPLTTLSNYDNQLAGCEITSNSEISALGTPVYNMFYNGTENLKFGIEFWLSFNQAPTQLNTLFSTSYQGNIVAQAFADNDKIYFTINGKDAVTSQVLSYTTYKQIQSWDSQLHVFLSYDNGAINVSVNSIPGNPVNVSSNFVFSDTATMASNFFYKMGPASSPDIFVINNLAFYDYILSTNTIRSHMVWGTNDSAPQNYVRQTSGFFFDIKDSETMFAFKKEFRNSADYGLGVTSTLVADSTGLTLNQTLTAQSSSGTWLYTVPSSGLSKISGVKVAWDSGMPDSSSAVSGDFIKVEFSKDNGSTWYQIENGYPVIKFPDSSSAVYPNMLVRVTISTSDASQKYRPRIDNLVVGVYKDLSIYSDMGAFALTPRQGSYTGDTYAIKNNSFNILARSENFGIKLDTTIDGSNSVAAIYPQQQTSLYQTIEFWFRYDDFSTSKVQYILDTLGTKASVYFNQDGGMYQNGFQNVYVNGVDISSGRYLIQGEAYHIVCIYSTPTSSTIYLGGDKTLTQYSRGTFGYLSIYPNALSVGSVQNRYLSFLTATVAQVDFPYSTSTVFGSSIGNAQSASNSLGTLSEFSGLSTDYNGGQPILAYTHPTNNA